MALLAVRRVLQRQGIAAADVTLTGHQASQKLLDIWQKSLAPGAMFHTIAEFGNIRSPHPVNLCLMQDTVRTPWVVALGLRGTCMLTLCCCERRKGEVFSRGRACSL